jgi:acyl-coenzyme A thioesterase PaaI-like protein
MPTPAELDVVAYPDLPPPALPASVEAWQDAVVRVSVELAGGSTHDQQGLVVSDGAVLTVLDLTGEITSLSVNVSGRGTLAAELERFDPRTGAALLTIEAEGLTVAPGERATVAHGEPALLLSRNQDGELVVEETFASPSLNAPDDLFALLVRYTPYVQWGTVVVADGTPVGLAGETWAWFGLFTVSGPPPGPDQAAVLLGSALRLSQFASPDASITPAAVAYHGAGWARFVDGPAARGLLAEPVQQRLKGLGRPVPLDNLGRRPGYVLRSKPGTVLQLLYPTPQEMRGADGELLGSARYIVLWWAREGGASDLVLCGTDRHHLGAAFATHGLASFEVLMEGVPISSRSIVNAAPLPAPEDGDHRGDYQYPYAWELKADKPSYVQGEPATLTFTVTNISDWPAPLDDVPPRVAIRSVQERRDVAFLPYGNGHRVLQPDETASYTMTWDQEHFEGGRAAVGGYIPRVHLANAATNRWLAPGPRADLILE